MASPAVIGQRGPSVAPVGDPVWRNRIVGSGEEAPDQLVANPQNWRTHPGNQRDALRGSLSTVGWVQQILVNQRTGHVVDGHARVEEALSRGEPSVPVLYVDLSPEEEALVLATLDPIGAMALSDEARLRELLADLTVDDAGLAAMLEQLAPTDPKAGLTDPDDVPELGDETHIKRAAEGHLGYYAARVVPVANDDRADWSAAWALFPGDVIYSWHPAGATSLVHAAALQGSGFALRMQIIWAKSNFPIGRGDYHVRHEPCWYAVREGRPANRTNDRTQTTLWEINLDKNVEGGHSTQKPVECMARAIRNHHAPDVYDPFLGSGTTVIAAEMLDRRCYAMEIDPRYVAVAIKRWEDFTGKTSERIDG